MGKEGRARCAMQVPVQLLKVHDPLKTRSKGKMGKESFGRRERKCRKMP